MEHARMALTLVFVFVFMAALELTVRLFHLCAAQIHVRTVEHVLIILLHKDIHKDMEELVLVLHSTKQSIARS